MLDVVRRSVTIALALLVAVIASTPASAQVVTDEKEEGAWEFYIAPYAWFVSIEGTAGATDPVGGISELPIDLPFKDLSTALDFVFSVFATAKKDRWSFSGELTHVELSNSREVTLPGPGDNRANVGVELTMDEYELLAGYQMNEVRKRVFDVIFGLRFLSHDVKVRGDSDAPTELNLDLGDTWVDPFVGVRYYGPVSPHWFVVARGDVGGFGVGSFSAFRFNGGIGYLFKRLVDVSFQYKILKMDYRNNEVGSPDYYAWDAVEHGPALTLGFRF